VHLLLWHRQLAIADVLIRVEADLLEADHPARDADFAVAGHRGTQAVVVEAFQRLDLDVFDPSLMAAVGTPEPGGLSWVQVVSLLRRVGESRRIVGFDVCELSPGEGPTACSYTAARLVAKLAAYSTLC